ncbi:MAG: hypothetical protein CMJ47_13370 [Planctomyces sp.]|nr:hypothetical protein [Planctomyces sp.]
MNILEAIKDDNLLRPYLGDELQSWRRWMTALQAIYGLPIKRRSQKRLVMECTGRAVETLPEDGFDTALFLTGRRSGKSRVAAIIGAFEATLAGHERKLSRGERGIVPIISPSKSQSRIVHDYLRSIFETPLLRNQLVSDTKEGFELRSGTRIEILAGDWRTIRGFTLLAAIIDEACFFGVESESKVKSDTELIRAIKPALATVNGKLIAISSPYARKGWCYETWRRDHGNDTGDTLVWNCPSRTMNPTLPQKIVDREMANDPAAARAEFLGQWREDVAAFVPREVIEQVVVTGRSQLIHQNGVHYVAFADMSGGRSDDAALAIAHRENRTVVVDLIKRWKPPFSPHAVVAEMADELRVYQIRKVVGDNYAAEFVAGSFRANGIRYERCDKPKSVLYAELLPRLCSGELELPDDDLLVGQLANLERRTRSGGRDIIDHPHGGHDDVANAVAGVAVTAAIRRLIVGAL